MKIWVDADACPVVVKEILFRAAKRTDVQDTFLSLLRKYKSESHMRVVGAFE